VDVESRWLVKRSVCVCVCVCVCVGDDDTYPCSSEMTSQNLAPIWLPHWPVCVCVCV
jgi:hypothetical protein